MEMCGVQPGQKRVQYLRCEWPRIIMHSQTVLETNTGFYNEIIKVLCLFVLCFKIRRYKRTLPSFVKVLEHQIMMLHLIRGYKWNEISTNKRNEPLLYCYFWRSTLK